MRPLIGLATAWPFVLFIRFADRVGKGLRTSPRDALIGDVTSPLNRGRAYGFHRAMDHAGSVVGPLVASLLLLPFFGLTYRQVFLWAAVPALIAFLCLWFGVKEKKGHGPPAPPKLDLVRDWRKLGRGPKVLFLSLLIFTLGNSTDAFLLLKLSQSGVPTWLIPLLWGALHLVKMTATYYGGILSDHWGRKRPIVLGWLYFALIYSAFAFVSDPWVLGAIFLAYGVFFGLTEPSEKALVADLVPKFLRGTGFGYYHLVMGLGALPASVLFGLVAQAFGSPAAFGLGAALAALASVILGVGLKKA
jgi:MFS family permease